MRISQKHAAVITAVEAWGEQLGQMHKVMRWPGLTVEQRAIAYTAVMLEAPKATPRAIASCLGLDALEVVRVIKTDAMPFTLVGDRSGPVEDLAVYPSDALAYGDAE